MRQKSSNRIIVVLWASLAGFAFSSHISSASVISRENVVDLVNYSRAKEGLDALAENSRLNQAAMEKAKDMIQHNYFAHTSPRGATPWSWFEKNDYDYRYAGENLAINFQSAEEEHEAWMESPDHRKNILNPKYQEMGAAVERGMIDDRPAIVTVQMFGTRDGSASAIDQVRRGGSPEMLVRELESGPWSHLAFVKKPAQDIASGVRGAEQKMAKAGGKSLYSWRWELFFEGLAALLILASVGTGPAVFGWMLVKGRSENTQDVVYPIKLSLIK